jgi:C1A family cysteine protease
MTMLNIYFFFSFGLSKFFTNQKLSGLNFPVWPSRFTIRGTWKVPYTNLSNPILIVQEPDRQYSSKFNGLEQIWKTGPEEKIYRKIVYNDTNPICYGFDLSQPYDIEFTEFLPQPDGYILQSIESTYHGRKCELWMKQIDNAKVFTYKLYVDLQTRFPIAYILEAISMYSSHYDVYVLEINEFFPTSISGVWNFPSICQEADNNPDPYPGASLHQFFPHQKNSHTFKSINPVQNRFSFINHSKFIKDLRYRKQLRSKVKNSSNICSSWKAPTNVSLPDEFSWRDYSQNHTDVVGKVRDQVACGSCWAFATVDIIGSRIANKTNFYRDVSVNQVMDCTWDDDKYHTLNVGCGGGDIAPSLNVYISSAIKISYEEDYPYLGVSGSCGKNFDHVAGKVTKCYQIGRRNIDIKAALLTYGPLAIEINVIEPMLLYTSGVIDDQTCIGIPDFLNHAVILTGWKIIDGKEAWEIKNSWSTYWGDNGYMYIQSKNEEWNCGVTTNAVAVDVEVTKSSIF